MKTLPEVPDYSDLKREVEALLKRVEDLESGKVRPKVAGLATRWRWFAAKPALVLTAVMGAVLALGVLSAQNKQDPLFIDQNGYVGINQTKPESPLDVNGNAIVRGDLNLGNSILYFTNADHRAAATALQGGVAAIENSKDRAALEIFGRPTPTRRRVVAISDRLGIGTSFPNEALEVGGNAVVVGDLTIKSGGEIKGKLWTSQEYEWNQSQGSTPTKMTKANQSVCFLTSVRGLSAGGGESVEIKRATLNDGEYWVLTGTSAQKESRARAKCIGQPDGSS